MTNLTHTADLQPLADSEDAMTVERLGAFSSAWSAGDVDALMSMVTDDCVYKASVGPEPGTTYSGRDEVRRGFTEMLAHDEDAENKLGRCWVFGDLGFGEWAYVFKKDGRTVEVQGFDVFEFRGDKICVKNAYRKTFGDVTPTSS